jgi:hypothetical protein
MEAAAAAAQATNFNFFMFPVSVFIPRSSHCGLAAQFSRRLGDDQD